MLRMGATKGSQFSNALQSAPLNASSQGFDRRQLENTSLGRSFLVKKDSVMTHVSPRNSITAYVPKSVVVKDEPLHGMLTTFLGGMGTAAGSDAVMKHLALDQANAAALVEQGAIPKVTDQHVSDTILISLSSQIKDRTAYLLNHVYVDSIDATGQKVKATEAQIYDALTANHPDNPWPGILMSIKAAVASAGAVGKHAGIFMVCNTAHGWFKPIQNYLRENAPGSEIFHIADGVFAALGKDPFLREKTSIIIGLMATTGTQQTQLYQNRLKERQGDPKFAKEFGLKENVSIKFVIPDQIVQEHKGMGAIYGIGETEVEKLSLLGLDVQADVRTGGIKGGQLDIGRERAVDTAKHLVEAHGAQVISESCTEYPLVLGEAEEKDVGVKFIDATAAGTAYTKQKVAEANFAADAERLATHVTHNLQHEVARKIKNHV